MIAIILLIFWCWNKEMFLFLFCKYSWVLNIIVGFTKYCQYMVVYHQNLVNMLHNSVIIQSLLRIRKKIYKFSSLGGILHISAKLQGGICKTSCWLTEKFDGWGKLINVVQFQGVTEVLLISVNNWRNLQF